MSLDKGSAPTVVFENANAGTNKDDRYRRRPVRG